MGATVAEVVTSEEETGREVDFFGLDIGLDDTKLGRKVEVGVIVDTAEVGVGVAVDFGMGVLVEQGPVTVTGIQLISFDPMVFWTSRVP